MRSIILIALTSILFTTPAICSPGQWQRQRPNTWNERPSVKTARTVAIDAVDASQMTPGQYALLK